MAQPHPFPTVVATGSQNLSVSYISRSAQNPEQIALKQMIWGHGWAIYVGGVRGHPIQTPTNKNNGSDIRRQAESLWVGVKTGVG